MRLILGSQSEDAARFSHKSAEYEVVIPNADEDLITSTHPETKVIETAKLKASMLNLDDDSVILTCDTVVSFNDKIFEKPDTIDEARQMITALSGSTHEVYSAAILKSETLKKLFSTVHESLLYADSRRNRRLCSQ